LTPGSKADSITFRADEIIFIAAAEKIVQDTRIVPVSILVTGAEGVDPVAEKLIEYYVRPMHNFTDIFHGYQARVASLIYTDSSALHDISRITESRNKAATQILFRKQEKKRLELDLELFRRDEVEAGEYAEQLSAEVAKLTAELAAIFQRNQGYAEQLAKDQAALEAEINAKTAAATDVNSEQ
jgi:NhaP-type Na+/H+ and K+/H+ antiporter